MNQQQLAQMMSIFSRATPEQQQRMIQQIRQSTETAQAAREIYFEQALIQQELLSNAPWLETESLELDREIAKTGYQTPAEQYGYWEIEL